MSPFREYPSAFDEEVDSPPSWPSSRGGAAMTARRRLPDRRPAESRKPGASIRLPARDSAARAAARFARPAINAARSRSRPHR
jgi:hypothetical protein